MLVTVSIEHLAPIVINGTWHEHWHWYGQPSGVERSVPLIDVRQIVMRPQEVLRLIIVSFMKLK